MRKPAFCIYAKTKPQISCALTTQLISAFVFATQIVQSLYYLNLKFQASSHLLWLHSPICVGPGRKPQRPVFSQLGSNQTKQSRFSHDVVHSDWIETDLQMYYKNYLGLSQKCSQNVWYDLSPVARKPVFWVSNQGCIARKAR